MPNHHNEEIEENDDQEMNIALVQAPETDYVESQDMIEGSQDIISGSPISSAEHSSHRRRQSISWNLAIGLLSAAPTLALIGFGSGQQKIVPLFIYTTMIVSTSVPAFYLRQKHGVLRWFVGFFVLAVLSGFKSGLLLAPCKNLIVKAGLYAITALWECSNAVLIIGGDALLQRFGISDMQAAILYVCAPSQVCFVTNNGQTTTTTRRNKRRSIHIGLCGLGLGLLYFTLNSFESLRNFISSVVILELECMAIMASLMVVLLDLPSHLWQCIHDHILPTMNSAKVVLPYGWIYSCTSTRQFWSKWSRPATQLIRHLLYYPLGGRARWYLSIPIMFGLNATSHYDLSFSIVGDRAELWWNLIFGTLALVAMMEVVGDSYFSSEEALPKWYVWTRGILLHLSLRLVLFFMIHKCFKTSLGDFWV